MDIEKRKYTRFSANANTFAALRNGFERVGKVNDISKNGVAFSYLVESDKAGFDSDFSEVDIFLSENRFHLHKVPCKIVYVIQDPKFIVPSITKRRCGLQFSHLSKSQSEQLAFFLNNYTTGPLPS